MGCAFHATRFFIVTPRRVAASGLSTVMITFAPSRRIERTTSPTAALASALPWTSSVSWTPFMARIVSPLITRFEAAQPVLRPLEDAVLASMVALALDVAVYVV